MDDAARMLPQGEELHQTVGSEAAVQIEGCPGEAAAARNGEEDADTLRQLLKEGREKCIAIDEDKEFD